MTTIAAQICSNVLPNLVCHSRCVPPPPPPRPPALTQRRLLASLAGYWDVQQFSELLLPNFLDECWQKRTCGSTSDWVNLVRVQNSSTICRINVIYVCECLCVDTVKVLGQWNIFFVLPLYSSTLDLKQKNVYKLSHLTVYMLKWCSQFPFMYQCF